MVGQIHENTRDKSSCQDTYGKPAIISEDECHWRIPAPCL